MSATVGQTLRERNGRVHSAPAPGTDAGLRRLAAQNASDPGQSLTCSRTLGMHPTHTAPRRSRVPRPSVTQR